MYFLSKILKFALKRLIEWVTVTDLQENDKFSSSLIFVLTNQNCKFNSFATKNGDFEAWSKRKIGLVKVTLYNFSRNLSRDEFILKIKF